jgi:urease accessory protein
MYPIALGAVAASVGLGPLEVALAAAQSSVSGPAWAATRLLGIDPFAVGRCLAELAPAIEQVASEAGALTSAPSLAEAIAELPSCAAVLVEIGAEAHAAWEVRLFAS